MNLAAILLALPIAAFAAGPTIVSVVNNYSYIPAGFPNSGISPGSIFVIFGSGMADAPAGKVSLESTLAPGLPKTLAGASLSVSAGGVTVTPAMYYATPGQIAAVLPSNTPAGPATLTVTYNGATSNAFSFQVAPNALGLGTYSGDGAGLVLATNNINGALYDFTNSAKPGETIVLWGSGLGADRADSDTVFTTSPHAVNTPLKIYFGGVAGKILYAGSSGYPGYNQIDVTIPDNVPTGCYGAVVGVAGSGTSTSVSNFGSLPIAPSGGECNDSLFGISGTTIATLRGKNTVNSASLFVGQLVTPALLTDNVTQASNIASASFSQETGTAYGSSNASSNGSTFSVGSCFVSEVVSPGGGGSSTSTPLDAGNISLAGPAGTYFLSEIATGSYQAMLPANAITSSGGAFTFNGGGGSGVGSFKTTVSLPNPILNWTNQTEGATINRSQGIQIDWTGGGAGSYLIITGGSTDDATGASGSFTCVANQSDLSFLVPAYVTGALPAGPGTLDVENATGFGIFSARGLDIGLSFGFTGVTIESVYQ
jgi:uncharacterized protein (TIGR03437 family)